MLSKLHKLDFEPCSKQYYKIDLLPQIVVSQASSGERYNYSTKITWKAVPMSRLCTLSCLWMELIEEIIFGRERFDEKSTMPKQSTERPLAE
jgi:hypothetical protein